MSNWPMNLHPAVQDEVAKPLRSGIWRDEVRARATWLRSETRWLQLRHETNGWAIPEAIEEEVYKPLRRVEAYTRDPISIREWWSGSQVEECWLLLRQAEEGLLRITDRHGLRSLTKFAELHAATLGVEHSTVTELQEMRGWAMNDPTSVATEALRRAALTVVRVSHDTSDRKHRAARSFRNQLLALSLVLVALAGMALMVQGWLKDAHLLPKVETSMDATQTLAVAMFFGCIGALFSAIPSLAQIPESSSPFNMPRQQAILKVVAGAWSAVIGLLVMTAGLASAGAERTETTVVSSVGALAILAALFGAGQEAVTRFADHKASGILDSS